LKSIFVFFIETPYLGVGLNFMFFSEDEHSDYGSVIGQQGSITPLFFVALMVGR
jgi:hypothetical protein